MAPPVPFPAPPLAGLAGRQAALQAHMPSLLLWLWLWLWPWLSLSRQLAALNDLLCVQFGA